MANHADVVREGAAAAKDGAGTAVVALARSGYAARGIVYLIVGGLAVLAAFGPGGQTTDSRGALTSLLGAPFGKALLVVMGVGLLGYSLWRTIQGIKDTDHHGTGARGLAIRGGLLVSAVTHVLLAFTLGGGGSGGGGGSQGLASTLMQQPYGRVLVGLVGVAVIGAGIAHAVKGWTARFEKYMLIPADKRAWAHPVCRFGLITRAVVLIIIGGMFIAAAYQIDPSQAGGLADAFDAVRRQAYGKVLLGIIAIGLVAFGIYSLLEAVYRRVSPPT